MDEYRKEDVSWEKRNYYHEEECSACSFAPICNSRPSDESIVKRVKLLKKDEHNQKINQPFLNLYAIRSGLLKTYVNEFSGKSQILNFYFPGEIIGFELLDKEKYTFSTAAIMNSTVCEIPYHNLVKSIQSQQEIQHHIFSLISKRINLGSYLNHTNAEQRLASFILDMIKRLNCIGSIINLPFSQNDIANYLRLTPETICRIFHNWKKNGIIKEIHNRQIHLHDNDKLKLITQAI